MNNYYVPTDTQALYITAKQKYFARTYGIMTAGLLITFAAALLTAVFFPVLAYNPVLLMVLFLAELAIVIGFSAALSRASRGVVMGMFLLYAVVNGVTLSSVFLAFDISSIFLCFAGTALAFGVMSLFGARTDRELSPLRGVFFAGFIAILVISLASFFIGYRLADTLICCIGVVIFLCITAYDSQKLGDMFDRVAGTEMADRYAVYAAMQLYLDFINLFLYLLRILSKLNRNRN